jgi:hypothetical protein
MRSLTPQETERARHGDQPRRIRSERLGRGRHDGDRVSKPLQLGTPFAASPAPIPSQAFAAALAAVGVVIAPAPPLAACPSRSELERLSPRPPLPARPRPSTPSPPRLASPLRPRRLWPRIQTAPTWRARRRVPRPHPVPGPQRHRRRGWRRRCARTASGCVSMPLRLGAPVAALAPTGRERAAELTTCTSDRLTAFPGQKRCGYTADANRSAPAPEASEEGGPTRPPSAANHCSSASASSGRTTWAARNRGGTQPGRVPSRPHRDAAVAAADSGLTSPELAACGRVAMCVC